jgi:chorismate mutase
VRTSFETHHSLGCYPLRAAIGSPARTSRSASAANKASGTATSPAATRSPAIYTGNLSATGAAIVIAIRGAIQVDGNDAAEIQRATSRLLTEVMVRKDLWVEDFISVILTADLNTAFPATAARLMGFDDVPLICASEINVVEVLPRVVRLMVHVNTSLPRNQIGPRLSVRCQGTETGYMRLKMRTQ